MPGITATKAPKHFGAFCIALAARPARPPALVCVGAARSRPSGRSRMALLERNALDSVLVPEEELELKPDEDIVRLQEDRWHPGVYRLYNQLTGEVFTLLGNGLELCSSEGFTFVRGAQMGPTWSSELLCGSVYQSAGSGDVIIRCWDNKDRALFLNRKENYVHIKVLQIPDAITRKPLDLEVVVLPLERFGCRIYVSLSSAYNFMGLAKGEFPSAWVHKRLSGLLKALDDHGLAGQLARPLKESQSTKRRRLADNSAADVCNDLTKPSMTFVGFLFLLMRWGCLPKVRGGFGIESEQEQARAALRTILRALPDEPALLDLALGGHEGWSPPEMFEGSDLATFVVVDDAIVVVPPLPQELLDSDVEFLVNELGWVEGARIPLYEFVVRVATKCDMRGWRHLPVQLAIRLGLLVDKSIAPSLDWHFEKDIQGFFVWADAEHHTEHQRDLTAVRYWCAGRFAAETHKALPWTIICDGTRAGGKKIVNGAVVFPTNVAFQMPPMEMPDYDCEVTFLQASLPAEEVGTPEEPGKALLNLRMEWRAISDGWLSQKDTSVKPRKRHRRSAYEFLRLLDHQLRCSAGVSGLRVWCRVGDDPEWDSSHPLHWPVLHIVTDQCSEVVCAMNWLREKARACVEPLWDISHGVWNDVRNSIKGAKLWPFFITFILHRNARHGPWAQEQRYRQCLEATSAFFRLEDKSSPWFKEMIPKIMRDKQIVAPYSDEQIAQEWEMLKAQEPWKNKGTQVKLNRFMEGLRQAAAEDFYWHSRLLSQHFVALQGNLLSNSKVKAFLAKKYKVQPTGENQDDDQAGMNQPNPADVALRAVGKNMMTLSTLFLDDDDNQNMLRLLVVVTKETEAFHSYTNRELRSVDSSLGWLKDFCTTGIQRHINNIWKPLKSAEGLAYIGFVVPGAQVASIYETEAAILVDDDRARTMVTLMRQLCFARYKRCAFLFQGWPSKSILFLDEETRDSAVEELRKDFNNMKRLQRAVDGGAFGKEVLERSVFTSIPALQVAQHLENSGYEVDEAFKKWLTYKFKRAYLSQVAEDQNHTSRYMETASMNGKAMARAIYSRLIHERVLARRHDFDEVNEHTNVRAAPLGVERLAYKNFYTDGEESSMDFTPIAGYNQKPTWYSPGAGTLHIPYCDLALLRKIGNNFASLKTVRWLSPLLDADNLVLRPVGQTVWFMALGSVPGSSSWALPMMTLRVPGLAQNEIFLVPDTVPEPISITLADPSEWEATTITWRSPVWQAHQWAGAREWVANHVGIRAVLDGDAKPLLQIAAENGFWELNNSAVAEIAKNVGWSGMASQRSHDTIGLLEGLAKHLIPDCTDDMATKALSCRLKNMDFAQHISGDTLLQIDEAWNMMDREDEKEVRREQTDLLEKQASFKDYLGAFSTRQRKLREGAITELASTRRGGPKAKAASQPMLKKPDTVLSQESASALMPPNTSIWKVNASQGWAIHVKPFKRYSATACKRGSEYLAMIHVLRIAWQSYISVHPWEKCPIKGLVEDESEVMGEAQAASGAASSSSSREAVVVAEAAPATRPTKSRARK